MSAGSRYKTPAGMRKALEERLNRMSREQGVDTIRLRRHVAFDRFLARLFSQPMHGLVVKGGYVLELRMARARLTKDIDFSFTDSLGGAWFEPHDMLPTHDWLGFAGIPMVAVPAICPGDVRQAC